LRAEFEKEQQEEEALRQQEEARRQHTQADRMAMAKIRRADSLA